MHAIRIHGGLLCSTVLSAVSKHTCYEKKNREFHVSEFLSRIREKEYQSPKSNSNNAAENTNMGIAIKLCL